MFKSLDISASSLTAHRTWMDAIAGNIANMNATKDPKTGANVPYARRIVEMAAAREGDATQRGVRVSDIKLDKTFQLRHEEGNPDADADGNVKYPNIDMATEMVNMMVASRAYEANITMMETTKSMVNASLRLLA